MLRSLLSIGVLCMAMLACTPLQLDKKGGQDDAVRPAPEAASRPQPDEVASADQTETEPMIDIKGDWEWRDANEQWIYHGDADDTSIPMQSWEFAEQALRFFLVADEQLNLFERRPHTLVVRIFQLSNRRAFQDMRLNAAGIRYLLSSEAEAVGNSVVQIDQVVIEPGQNKVLTLDRAQETRYVGIVAGYFDPRHGRVSRLAGFPSIDDTEPVRYGLFDALTFGLFADEPEQIPLRPAVLDLHIRLGQNAIEQMAIQAY